MFSDDRTTYTTIDGRTYHGLSPIEPGKETGLVPFGWEETPESKRLHDHQYQFELLHGPPPRHRPPQDSEPTALELWIQQHPTVDVGALLYYLFWPITGPCSWAMRTITTINERKTAQLLAEHKERMHTAALLAQHKEKLRQRQAQPPSSR